MNNASIQGIVIAAFELGALVGALSCLDLGDRLGRRATVWLGMIFMLVGGALQCSAWEVGQLVTGRIISGIGVGLQVRLGLVPYAMMTLTIHGRSPLSQHGSRRLRSLILGVDGVSSIADIAITRVPNSNPSNDRRRSADLWRGVRAACVLGLLLCQWSGPVASSCRNPAASSIDRVSVHQLPTGISTVACEAWHDR